MHLCESRALFHFVWKRDLNLATLLQNAKRAARGYKTSGNFIAIAYLRMGKLSQLPQSPLRAATSN
jgi:hypothetical protein